ncbi:MAG: VPLPA-CTERM sorting domain-containing protein [Litoreibacter sp.]|nr:VPLPA-CTERM sorting domain-containing protein [Litoreibacter sp.]
MQRLLLTSALLGSTLAFAVPVHAQCAPDGGADGSVVTCSGTDLDGFDFKDADGITLTVENGATVQDAPGGNEAIRVDDDADITVEQGGTVSSFGDDAIQLDKDGMITNSGAIFSTTKDALNLGEGATVINTSTGDIDGDDEAIAAEDDLRVANSGFITAGDKAIDTEGFDDLTVINTGTINATDKAIRAGADDDDNGGNGLFVNNSGTIISQTDEGIESGNNAEIRNSGSIKAFDDAIQVGTGAMIVNSGLIENTAGAGEDPQDAIDIDEGIITNEAGGRIISTFDAAIDFDEGPGGGLVENFEGAEISGLIGIETDPGDTGGQEVDNRGKIIGTGGVAMNLGRGRDVVVQYDTGEIDGRVNLGEGEDTFALFGTDHGDVAGLTFIDGGADEDTFRAVDFLLENLVSVSFGIGTDVQLGFEKNGDATQIQLSSFEIFKFGNASTEVTRTLTELKGVLAPVPLPAAGWLLFGALGGLAALRRKR